MSIYNDVLNELQDYILYEDNINKSLKLRLSVMKQEKKYDTNHETKYNNHNIVKKPEVFIPNQQDTLFWCYYIIKNGDIAYETLNNKNTLIAKQMKIDLVSTIRKNKDTVKTYKFDTISNIENNLANDNVLNKKTFLALCAIENMNIIYISKKTYFELLMNDTEQVYVINEIHNNTNHFYKCGFEIISKEKINSIRESLYKLDTIDKPIKSISSYKVQDLIDICNKLAIETINKDNSKCKSKKDLYELIIQYF